MVFDMVGLQSAESVGRTLLRTRTRTRISRTSIHLLFGISIKERGSPLHFHMTFLRLPAEASNNKSRHRTFNDVKIETLHSEIATEASLRSTVLSSRRTCHSFPETYLYFSYTSA